MPPRHIPRYILVSFYFSSKTSPCWQKCHEKPCPCAVRKYRNCMLEWFSNCLVSIMRKKVGRFSTIALISHASKVMLKILQASFSNTWTVNFQMFKLVLEKAEEPEIKLPTADGSSKKQESSRKAYISALLTMPKPLTVWITINCGKFFKRWEYQTTWPASWGTCMQVRKQQLELDMEQQTGSK